MVGKENLQVWMDEEAEITRQLMFGKKVKEKIILFDEPGLVVYRTDLRGWSGPNNLYYGDGEEGERRARYGNCTHRRCTCGEIYPKDGFCRTCSSKKSQENFLLLEAVPWDEKSTMCFRNDDVFFQDMNEFIEWCIENEVEDMSTIQLMLCEQKFVFTEVNIDELNEEYTDGELGVSHYHPDVAQKVAELNTLLRETKSQLWFPTNKRIIIPDEVVLEIHKTE